MARDLKINRGTTYVITLDYERSGQPATLVGATVFFTVKNVEYDNDATDATATLKITKTTYTETGDDPVNGVAEIPIAPTDTNTITPGQYYYDIKVKDADGHIYKVIEGRLTLDGSPTNRLS